MTPSRAPRFSLRSYGAAGIVHAHEHAQAVLPLGGTLAIALDERGGRVDDGTGVLIPPRTAHRFSAQGANRFIVLDFDCRDGAGFFKVDRPLAHLLRYVGDIGARPLPADLQLHAAALLSAAVRRLARADSRLSAPVQRALALIGERYAEPLTVAEMAEAAGLSASHLHAEFRRQLGKSPARQLADVRLAVAAQRLRQGDEPIAQVALACGYSEQSALTRALRRNLGITPAALRRS